MPVGAKVKQQIKGALGLIAIGSCVGLWMANRPAPDPKSVSDDAKRSAAERTVRYLQANWGHSVAIWRNDAAMEKALAFISAGEDERHAVEVAGQVACLVLPGNKAIITDPGMSSTKIFVVEGPNDGCEGVVETASLAGERPKSASHAP